MKLLRTAIVCAACLCPASAQQSFDVTSVKPGVTGVVPQFSLSLGRLHASNVNIKELIAEAYQVNEGQVSGPEWLPYEAYNLDARSGGSATMAQSRLMLQSLLADRFHLKIHRDKKEMTVYTLSVANGKTARLTRADTAGCQPEPSPANPCQRIEGYSTLALTGERVSMPQFCKFVSKLLYYPVTDKTGMAGVYNWKLDLSAFFAGDRTDGLPLTVTALRGQLGLKLERTKSAVDLLVIEHVEKPSAN